MYGYMPKYIDHINGIPDDNRIVNLREVTQSQNQANNYKLLRGVEKHGRKYRARIKVDGAKIELGSYDTVEEAHKAYYTAAEKILGEYARCNR